MDLIKCIKLNKNTLILVDFNKVFNKVIINYTFKFKKTKVFIIFKAYFNNNINVKVNTMSLILYFIYIYIK
jgi:hypothetical protein